MKAKNMGRGTAAVPLLFILAALVSCAQGDIEAFFKENSYTAVVSSVEFSGEHSTGTSGKENIPADSDYEIYFYIDNPTSVELKPDVTFENESVSAPFEYDSEKRTITLTYPASLLSALDGLENNDISPTVKLMKAGLDEEATDEEIMKATEDVYTLNLSCNSPPMPAIQAQSAKESESGITDRLVLISEFPSFASDLERLVIEENGNKHTFSFDYETQSFTATDGESWALTQTEPDGLGKTYESQEEFSTIEGGSVWYVVTDIGSISTRKQFEVSYTFYDTEGLSSEVYTVTVPEKSAVEASGTVTVKIADDVEFSCTSTAGEGKISSTGTTTIKLSATLDGSEDSAITITQVTISSGSVKGLSEYSNGSTTTDTAYQAYITTNDGSSIVFKAGIPAGTTVQIFVSGTYDGQTYGTTFEFSVE
nr:hypothetical protein [Treponema sp.]